MEKYEVTITELLKKKVYVDDESPEMAEQHIADAWKKGEYILDADNFAEISFVAKKQKS